MRLELVGELLTTGLGDAAPDEHVHVVGLDVLQDARVVRDEQDAGLAGGADPVDALGHHPQRVDVEAGVGLVQDGDPGLEQLELQDLVALLLSAGEALVDAALGEGRVHLQPGHGLLLLLDPEPQLRGLAADSGGGRAQEVRHADAGHLDRVLHGQEQPGAGALVDGHREDVLAVERHGAAGDLVLRVTGDGVGQGRLAGAVRPHDRVRLAGADGEVDAGEDLLVLDADLEAADLQRRAGGALVRGSHQVLSTSTRTSSPSTVTG